MAQVKFRVWVVCAQCQKRFSLQGSDHRKRLQHSAIGELYCSRTCFDAARAEQKMKGVV